MKIAIPIYGKRIAPRFDYARQFLVIKAENGLVVAREQLPAENWSRMSRIRKLNEFGVDTVICSGIDRVSEQQLHWSGMRVYAWVTGEAEDALSCLFKGELESGLMAGRDGRQCGRWRFIGKGGIQSDAQFAQLRGRGGRKGRWRTADGKRSNQN